MNCLPELLFSPTGSPNDKSINALLMAVTGMGSAMFLSGKMG